MNYCVAGVLAAALISGGAGIAAASDNTSWISQAEASGADYTRIALGDTGTAHTSPARKPRASSSGPFPPPAMLPPPMRLGVIGTEAPKRRSAAASVTPRSNCLKWRRIADRLGETYAGLRLRQSVVDRACLFADPDLNTASLGREYRKIEHWSWPWAQGAIDSELPPRIHGQFGDWTIRCGVAGLRERCALIHETAATERAVRPEVQPVSAAAGDAVARVVTHFVIDTISGQTQVVWRVFVARRHAPPETAMSGDETGSWSPGTQRAGIVRYVAGTLEGSKRFDGCNTVGCLMEADVAASARVATRLWEGGSTDVTVFEPQGSSMTAAVSSLGFRAGLGELARLKRAEERVLAGN